MDYSLRTVPACKVACIIRRGPYTGQNMWRHEFNQLTKWAKKHKVRTGKWIMGFIDEWKKVPDKRRRSMACIEIKGKAKAEGRIQVMTIPRQKVVSVTFDPDKISAGIIYDALESWLQYKPYRQAARSREVYSGDPWTNKRAWANCEVQVPLKRK